MARGVEELKETAPCGMRIRYTVDLSTDFVTYNDINGRGENRYTDDTCKGCSWRSLCKPTEADYLEIVRKAVGREVDPMEIIWYLFDKYGGHNN